MLEHLSQSNLTLRTPKKSEKSDICTRKFGPGFKKGAPVLQGGTWRVRNLYHPLIYWYRGIVKKFQHPQTPKTLSYKRFREGGMDSIPPPH